ncbi:MAG TPA: porin, partial [Hyphomicrobium sp.]|nr:porin [Hyphomicrobium sp.]
NYYNNAYGGLDSNNTYYIKGGIRQRWNPLGHTVLYGEYERAQNHNSATGAFVDGVYVPGDNGAGLDFIGSSEVRMWGLGAVQEIDAAAMSLWIKYRNVDASTSGINAFDTDRFNEVTAGALINF